MSMQDKIDAARYRLVRSMFFDDEILAELAQANKDPETPEAFDAAIDAVLRKRGMCPHGGDGDYDGDRP